jgi:tetratricopeptide (TPR) repeat protein
VDDATADRTACAAKERHMIRAAVWVVWFVAAGILVYGNGLDAPFVYDDRSIQEDRDIRRPLPPWEVVHASPNSPAAGRPVVHYSLALNFALGGLDVWGYRASNLAVHLVCALVLFGVVRRTLSRAGGDGEIGLAAEGLAAAAAMIWMLHPLQTECVNYISQRSESLMGLFYLLTLYASIRALDARTPRSWTAAAIVCCALGMASKEVMVTAPLIVPLYDAVFAGRSPRQLLRERGALYAGLAACWAVLAGLMATGPRADSVGFSLGTSALEYAKNQCVAVVDYLRLIFWPDPLTVDYGYPQPLSVGEVAPYAVTLVALLAVTVWALVRWPKTGFAAAWTFIILAPTSSLVPIVTEVAAERRMYLPLAGPVVLAVVGAYVLIRRMGVGRHERWVAAALLLVVVTPLAWRSVLRNEDYASGVSIWRNAVEARPGNPRAHGNLGKALQQAGRPDDAMIHYRRALELRPDYPEALNNMAGLLLALGERSEAIEHFRRALEAKPNYANAHYNLARAHQYGREYDEAVVHYREALRWEPDHAKAHNNLGTVLGSMGKLDEAIEHFREALRLEPGYVVARDNLEMALERSRRTEAP